MTPTVALETSQGRIVLELDRERAPQTVRQILAHVHAGFYDDLIFHRVIKDFVVQTGGTTTDGKRRTSSAPPLENEADNGLKNVRGTVAMARGSDPHSATVQFFINVADNKGLDFQGKSSGRDWGYAVFGRVIEGMEVVDSIAAVPTKEEGSHRSLPVEPIVIERAYVVDEGAEQTGERR